MTLVIGKKCSDGVLLIADSVRIIEERDNGALIKRTISNDAVKSFDGVRGGVRFALVFSGYAGVSGDPIIDAFSQAITQPEGDLLDSLGKAVNKVMIGELTSTDWSKDPKGKQQLEDSSWTKLTVALGHDSLCTVVVRCKSMSKNCDHGSRMLMDPITTNKEHQDQLDGLCDHGVQNLVAATATAAQVFAKASELCRDLCRFPAIAYHYRADGCSKMTFESTDELLAKSK